MLISRRDFEARQAIVHELPFIMDGLFIVVQEDGYRIVKKEHKTSRTKANEDFDLYDMEQIRSYQYLEELLPELVNAYETLTGHRVTPTSTEPRWYVSSHSSKAHNRGLH